MGKTLIFGHKNPDTDSICSAIVYADLKTKLGMNCEAVRLGEVNEETTYALNYFQVDAPRFVKTAADEVDSVILVDHNERQQSIDDIDKVRILEVIDHHRIANFETKDPLYYRGEPVGCTATIIHKMYKENNVQLDKKMAGLLLSAIISDSLLFKSPTCTDEDIQAARELEKIAGVKSEEYGLEMLKAGANVGDKTAAELISLDAKEFTMGNNKLVIAQLNTVDVDEVLEKQAELEEAMKNTIAEKELDLFLFIITDILNNDSVALVQGEKSDALEKAFDVTLENNKALLKGVVSRKKQVVPPLQESLQ